MAPMRVIIADDSVAYRSALHKLLASLPGITVIGETQTGLDTLQLVRTLDPDLLILDIHMPYLSGWDVLRDLQAVDNNVRVLVHSGYANEHFRQQALQHGAVAYVAKGDVQLLVDTLNQLTQDQKPS
jgi:DNA-binding NarL/FixJ family response regulator